MEKPTPPQPNTVKNHHQESNFNSDKKTLRYLTSIPHSQQPYTRTAPTSKTQNQTDMTPCESRSITLSKIQP